MEFASPTVSRCAPKMILMVGRQLGHNVGMVDISSAFTQSALLPVSARLIILPPPYVELPWKSSIDPCFVAKQPPEYGRVTLRPLYGTSCAPLRRFATISAQFKKKSWIQLESDACVFRLERNNGICGLAAIHVDDIICSANSFGWESFLSVIADYDHTPIEYLSEMNSLVYLGLDVGMLPGGNIYPPQGTFVREKLATISDDGMIKKLDTPAEISRRKTTCKQATGKLIWLLQTRPDIPQKLCTLASEINISSWKYATFLSWCRKANKIVSRIKSQPLKILYKKFISWPVETGTQLAKAVQLYVFSDASYTSATGEGSMESYVLIAGRPQSRNGDILCA